MKLIITKTLKPTLLAASLVLAFPAIAAEALSGSYETINTPDGFTMSTGDTVISEDGKFVTGGSMQDMNGATLILKSENASIKTGGRFFMGSGATSLFKSNAGNLWKHFFKTGDFSFLEVYFLFSLSLLNVLLCVWLPIYYIFHFVYLGFAGYGGIELTLFSAEYYRLSLWNTIFAAAGIAVGLFILFGYIQGLILAITDYKKLGAKNRRALTGTVFGFPAFLILYGITLLVGACSKPSWGRVARNVPSPSESGAEKTDGADGADGA